MVKSIIINDATHSKLTEKKIEFGCRNWDDFFMKLCEVLEEKNKKRESDEDS